MKEQHKKEPQDLKVNNKKSAFLNVCVEIIGKNELFVKFEKP